MDAESFREDVRRTMPIVTMPQTPFTGKYSLNTIQRVFTQTMLSQTRKIRFDIIVHYSSDRRLFHQLIESLLFLVCSRFVWKVSTKNFRRRLRLGVRNLASTPRLAFGSSFEYEEQPATCKPAILCKMLIQ